MMVCMSSTPNTHFNTPTDATITHRPCGRCMGTGKYLGHGVCFNCLGIGGTDTGAKDNFGIIAETVTTGGEVWDIVYENTGSGYRWMIGRRANPKAKNVYNRFAYGPTSASKNILVINGMIIRGTAAIEDDKADRDFCDCADHRCNRCANLYGNNA